MTVYGVTDRFRAAYQQSHRVIAQGYITDGINGNIVIPALAFDINQQNEVTVDVTAANRRSVTLTIIDTDHTLLPLTALGPLAPIGNEVILSRGIQYVDDTDELVPLGVFGITGAQAARSPIGPAITITGVDRSKRLDVILTNGLSFAAGTGFDTIIDGLANASGVTFPTNYDPIVAANLSAALVFAEGDNIWSKIQDSAASIGCWAYFDVNGNLTVEPIPDPDSASVEWAYIAGTDAVFDETTNALLIEDGTNQAYSHAIVESTANTATAPLRGDAFDNDPSSPTYYLGPFGDRAIRDDGTLGAYTTTQDQVDTAAAGLLRRNYGLLERVTFRAAPNPALAGGDILAMTDPVTGIDDVYVSETFNMPLFAAGGTMGATLRSRQLH